MNLINMCDLARKPPVNQRRAGHALLAPLLLLSCLLTPATGAGGELTPYSKKTEPALSLLDLKGNKHSLSDYRGKVVLVNFWASWCPPCIREMPELQKLKKHFVGRPFEILTINVAEPEDRISQFSRSIKLTLPVLLDVSSKTYHRWGVNILPTSFLIDSVGQIRYSARGNPGWDENETLSTINALLPAP